MMPRRRQPVSQVELFIQFIGFTALLLSLTPLGRQVLLAIGAFAFWFGITAVIGLIAFMLWKKTTRSSGTVTEPFTSCLVATTQSAPNSTNAIQPQLNTIIESKPRPKALIERVRELDWFQFEKIIATAYRKSGFSVLRKGGANPDGGIDLLITDTAGKQTAIQCKQWKTWNVSVRIVREFLGALTDAGIEDGIIVTIQGYTGEAKQLANKHRIQLLNESDVEELLKRAHAEYDPEILALLDDTRKFCPKCEREMVLRTSKRGRNPGSQFWGCSAFPRCDFTIPCNTVTPT